MFFVLVIPFAQSIIRSQIFIFSCLHRDDVAAIFESSPDSSAAYYFILRGVDKCVRYC